MNNAANGAQVASKGFRPYKLTYPSSSAHPPSASPGVTNVLYVTITGVDVEQGATFSVRMSRDRRPEDQAPRLQEKRRRRAEGGQVRARREVRSIELQKVGLEASKR